ncbi:hypothetical protein ACFLZV_03300 [Candidatus Margulisiibacteriota bacterium]
MVIHKFIGGYEEKLHEKRSLLILLFKKKKKKLLSKIEKWLKKLGQLELELNNYQDLRESFIVKKRKKIQNKKTEIKKQRSIIKKLNLEKTKSVKNSIGRRKKRKKRKTNPILFISRKVNRIKEIEIIIEKQKAKFKDFVIAIKKEILLARNSEIYDYISDETLPLLAQSGDRNAYNGKFKPRYLFIQNISTSTCSEVTNKKDKNEPSYKIVFSLPNIYPNKKTLENKKQLDRFRSRNSRMQKKIIELNRKILQSSCEMNLNKNQNLSVEIQLLEIQKKVDSLNQEVRSVYINLFFKDNKIDKPNEKEIQLKKLDNKIKKVECELSILEKAINGKYVFKLKKLNLK